jgi:uncharacterized RDD family membrane protein YckC/DNA-directed RNA polymerase subunit RPC12/RpoP
MKKYGGFWIRVGAYVIDAVVMLVPVLIVRRLTFTALSSSMPEATLNLIVSLAQTFLWWLYSAVLESSELQATLGKMACGLKVVDEYGNRISFARASGRYFAQILSGLILGIGFIMIGLTRRKQGLHDILAGTLVTRKRFETATESAEDHERPTYFSSADTKRCPACAEIINSAAKKCRFCGEVFDPDLRESNNLKQFNTCPKCDYKRQPKDNEYTPATECPKCGVIYGKFMEAHL